MKSIIVITGVGFFHNGMCNMKRDTARPGSVLDFSCLPDQQYEILYVNTVLQHLTPGGPGLLLMHPLERSSVSLQPV